MTPVPDESAAAPDGAPPAASATPDAGVWDRIVKANDVRGLLGTDLTPDVVRALGVAVAQELGRGAPAIAVGRDMRPSGTALVAAFVAGVTAAGVDVVDVGLVSTDELYFASGHLDLPAVMFTASHNPAGWNGLKICRAGAAPVGIESGLDRIRDRARAAATDPPAAAATPGSVTVRSVDEAFARRVRSFADLGAADLHIAVDAGNGMAGKVVPLVFDPLPIAIDELCFELDGTFPNHPANPLEPANLVHLSEHVVARGLPLGLAFDGDADRMFAVDEHGRAVSSSLLGAVVATGLLSRHPGATVLHNLVCSRSVPDAVVAAGGTPVRTRVGHTFIKARMAETDAVFAVEHSGHYYFRDFHRADSGLVAAMLVLEAVVAADAPLSQVVAPYDRWVASGEHNFTVPDPLAALEAVAAAFAGRAPAVDRLDGVTVELERAWINVRPSNTEPLLRVNVEGRDADSMRRLLDEVAGIVG